MGTARPILILAAGAVFCAGPLLAQTSVDDIARRLTDSPQDIAALQAGRSGPPSPIQTFEYSPPPDAPALGGPVQGQALVVAAPASRNGDEVEGLVVQAPSGEENLPGPAWWKASGQGATIWIMGTPDLLPLATQFDHRALEKHMAAAKMLVIPGSPTAQVLNQVKATPALPKTPLDQRLPPDLYARLASRIGMNDVRAQADRNLRMALPGIAKVNRDALPFMVPLEFSATYVVTSQLIKPLTLPGNMGNPARDAAKSLAARRPDLFIKDVGFSGAAFTSFRATIDVPEDLQQACMSQMLDFLDAGMSLETLQADVQAWTIGDVTHALKHANPLTGCQYGPLAGNFWGRLTTAYVEAIRSAAAKGGESVAIVEFDPLLAKGGVLDQLAAAGFTITPPATL